MTSLEQVTALIPHRPPFLWVDKIISCDAKSITTEKLIETDLDVFQGHYPGNPIMPGVLLCEVIFQSGALLMAQTIQFEDYDSKTVPILTRIEKVKFKRQVLPGDTAQVKVTLRETLSSVYFLKGVLKVLGKTAVQASFSCALANTAENV